MHHRSASAPRLAGSGLLLAAVATIAASVAACGLMDAPPSVTPSGRTAASAAPPAPTPTETDEAPTDRPIPSGAVDLVGSAEALADHDSYRAAVVSRGLVPSSAGADRVTMTSTLILGDHPAAAFTLDGVDGFEGFGSGPIHAIVVGDQAWIRSGTGSWRKTPGGAADFDAAFTTLSPIELVGSFEGLAPAFVRVGSETKNGRATTHYRVDPADQAAADAGLTAGGIDLWLARPGGELIAIVADGTFDVDGTATPVLLRIDVTHIDDPANRVRPPG